MSSLKSIKGGKTEAEPEIRTMTLRGVTYTIREADVVEYKAAIKSATGTSGMTAFGDLLEQLVMLCVSPSPASLDRPMPYPIYRMLEGVINEMHFEDVEDESGKDDEGTDAEPEQAPNS